VLEDVGISIPADLRASAKASGPKSPPVSSSSNYITFSRLLSIASIPLKVS
jgi:hypothetical protein